jgi:hypothetical protein
MEWKILESPVKSAMGSTEHFVFRAKLDASLTRRSRR